MCSLKEKIRQRNKEYYISNKNKIVKRSKDRYIANRVKLNEQQKKYYFQYRKYGFKKRIYKRGTTDTSFLRSFLKYLAGEDFNPPTDTIHKKCAR
jgi:hypothetical protein